MDVSSQFNSLNQKFYLDVSQHFSDSRQYFWKGWDQLWQVLLKYKIVKPDFSIMDLGCGNARFYEYILQQIKEIYSSNNLDYVGLDFTSELLLDGQKKYGNQLKLIKSDVLVDNWPSLINNQKFDLVVAFGLVHHLKQGNLRDKFFENVRQSLNIDSLFIFPTWNFVDNQALMGRKADLNDPEIGKYLDRFDIKTADFTENDYLIDWKRGQSSWRFCHYYTEIEVKTMLEKYRFNLIEKFSGDGKNNLMNSYWVCKKV